MIQGVGESQGIASNQPTNSQPIQLIRGSVDKKELIRAGINIDIQLDSLVGPTNMRCLRKSWTPKIQDTAVEKGRFSRSLPKAISKTYCFFKSCR